MEDADAARQAATADDALRAEAAYVAGMSAYKLDDLPGAEQRLDLACASPDPQVAGRAYAQLGSIKRSQKRYLEAAADFNSAASRLQGDESTKARHEAGVASRAAGSPTGGRGATAGAPQAAVAGPWTLQGGCFRDRANADRSAATISSMSVAKGLGPARVVAVNEGNGLLFCVMIGEFASRQAAEDAKARLGRPEMFSRAMP